MLLSWIAFFTLAIADSNLTEFLDNDNESHTLKLVLPRALECFSHWLRYFTCLVSHFVLTLKKICIRWLNVDVCVYCLSYLLHTGLKQIPQSFHQLSEGRTLLRLPMPAVQHGLISMSTRTHTVRKQFSENIWSNVLYFRWSWVSGAVSDPVLVLGGQTCYFIQPLSSLTSCQRLCLCEKTQSLCEFQPQWLVSFHVGIWKQSTTIAV